MGDLAIHKNSLAQTENVCGGTSTIGFRSSKYTPEEWNSYHNEKYFQSAKECEQTECVDDMTKSVIKSTNAISQKLQADSTKRLKERLHDILFWKQELNREINDIIQETSILINERDRLQSFLLETDLPLQIATENLNTREYRRGIDKVTDSVESELYIEMELIQNIQKLIKNAIEQADKQICQNREVKEALEINWSDKKEAEEIDTKAGNLKNCSTNKQFYAGVALCQENMSSVERWAKDANEVITRAETERLASIDLRSLISNLILDTSRDIRQQFDRVNAAFQNNLNQLTAAKTTLEENLKSVVYKISLLEHNLNELKEAIRAKDDPLMTAQTRLHLRTFRPNMELCKDPASVSLVDEVNILGQSLDELLHQYSTVENKLKDLHDTQMALEKEIELKTETIYLDQTRCLPRRTYYPSAVRLQGY
uniref:Tektin n=3 Tax=Schistosoma japonicum TaxID=6182 RepID=C1L671_SCHJA|nr:Tektin-4 [Schistosoma japonicum]